MGPLPQNSYAAILGRWQPVHLGHQAALTALCQHFKRVVIGIGSSNIHDYRNPFSISEVTEMLHLCLKCFDNFTFVPIPDMEDDQEWCKRVVKDFGQPEILVSANPYVTHLLDTDFYLVHPANLVSDEKKVAISATMVRRGMAQGDKWFPMVPVEVKNYILKLKIDKRFRLQFGLQTLFMETVIV